MKGVQVALSSFPDGGGGWGFGRAPGPEDDVPVDGLGCLRLVQVLESDAVVVDCLESVRMGVSQDLLSGVDDLELDGLSFLVLLQVLESVGVVVLGSESEEMLPPKHLLTSLNHSQVLPPRFLVLLLLSQTHRVVVEGSQSLAVVTPQQLLSLLRHFPQHSLCPPQVALLQTAESLLLQSRLQFLDLLFSFESLPPLEVILDHESRPRTRAAPFSLFDKVW